MRVIITGLRETQSAFRKYDRKLGKDFRDELKKAAEPVERAVASKLGRFAGVGKPRTHVMGRGVFVRQSASKVTGLRGDFGALQMRTAFIPALEENEGRVVGDLENALDRFANNAGF